MNGTKNAQNVMERWYDSNTEKDGKYHQCPNCGCKNIHVYYVCDLRREEEKRNKQDWLF
jgi:hypothetical protein